MSVRQFYNIFREREECFIVYFLYFQDNKNHCFDVVYHIMKYGLVTSQEVTEYFRERSYIEEINSKMMTKLANKACSVRDVFMVHLHPFELFLWISLSICHHWMEFERPMKSTCKRFPDTEEGGTYQANA